MSSKRMRRRFAWRKLEQSKRLNGLKISENEEVSTKLKEVLRKLNSPSVIVGVGVC